MFRMFKQIVGLPLIIAIILVLALAIFSYKCGFDNEHKYNNTESVK
jgi:hypothetical protein